MRSTVRTNGSIDLRWSHEFALAQPVKGDDGPALSLGVDFFNITNRVNYSTFVGNLNSPFFGQATSSQPARRVQFSAEFHF